MIRVQGLTKRYAGREVLHGLDFEVGGGEIFGYLGPNGAGKTTTMKILATVESPGGGVVQVAGFDAVADRWEVRRRIGFMPEMFGMYEDLQVWEYLDFFARVYELPVGRRDSLIADVLALTDLTSKRDAPVGALSRGVRQRVYLAKTMLHDPQVLLLDEPASGLDPRARIELMEILRELRSRGKTVFISSHILAELSDLCDRVGILESGRMVACGRIDEIARQSGPQVQIVAGTLGPCAPLAAALADRAGVTAIEVHGERVQFALQGGRPEVAALLRTLIQAGHEIVSFEVRERDLESVFLDLTRGEVA